MVPTRRFLSNNWDLADLGGALATGRSLIFTIMIKIKHGVELPPIRRQGRPRGFGRNIDLLKSMKPGDTAWNIGWRRLTTIIKSAKNMGLKLKYRKIPGTRSYAFQIETKEQDEL